MKLDLSENHLLTRLSIRQFFAIFHIYLSGLANFEFDRRVHFARRCKMLKTPIAELPAILLDFINRQSGDADCIYEANIKLPSTRP